MFQVSVVLVYCNHAIYYKSIVNVFTIVMPIQFEVSLITMFITKSGIFILQQLEAVPWLSKARIFIHPGVLRHGRKENAGKSNFYPRLLHVTINGRSCD
jgi:hypothetical protein